MSRFCINATWDDVPHLTAGQKDALWSAIPPHQRKARAQGLPVLGEGLVFPVDEELIREKPFRVPDYWPRLGALDFGYDHPFAAVEIAYDSEADVVHVVKTYRSRQATPLVHVSAIRKWGEWLPWAWPHDGLQHEKGSGVQLAKQYGEQGLRMMGVRATFSDGTSHVEPGITDMLGRMESGRFFVFDHLNDWFEEFRRYHRKDGKIVKVGDDLMSATRYGVMMLRNAMLPPHVRAEARKARSVGAADPLAGF